MGRRADWSGPHLMRAFTDTAGRSWEIAINVAQLKRLRAKLGLDFLHDDKGLMESIGQVQMDPELLASLLFVLVEKQSEAAAVTAEDFEEALAGDVIADATEAFILALVEFLPPHRRRPLAEAVGAMREAMGRATDRAVEMIRSPEMLERIDRAMAEAGEPSTSSPESSELTPDPTHSGG